MIDPECGVSKAATASFAINSHLCLWTCSPRSSDVPASLCSVIHHFVTFQAASLEELIINSCVLTSIFGIIERGGAWCYQSFRWAQPGETSLLLNFRLYHIRCLTIYSESNKGINRTSSDVWHTDARDPDLRSAKVVACNLNLVLH